MPFYLFFIRRILFAIPTLLGITVVSFIIAHAIPADPINANLPQSMLNDKPTVQAFREKWGLDKPLTEQYLIYLSKLLQGDMGISIKTRKPVADDIRRYMPATIELATFGILVGIVMGVSFGIISAVWRNSIVDYLVRVFSLVGVSFPIFLLALIGLTVLYAQMRLVAGPGRLDIVMQPPPSITGMYTIDTLLAGQWGSFKNSLSHLILPSFVLGCYVSGFIARITRSSLLDVLGLDYIRTARAKGLNEVVVIWRHGLSNALIPVVTVIGLSYGNLLSGAVLTESIFSWPGIGSYMYRASSSQDFPAIMGGSILIAFVYIGVNFIVDILYYFLDPRIRLT